jgi:ATP-dependent Clp protease protease subunit
MFEPTAPSSISLPTPKARELYFTKQVTQDTIGELTKEILEINRNDLYLEKVYNTHGLEYKPAPIKLHIDSYGGSVYQCLGLCGVMDNSKTPIHTYVIGVAMSAGFMISIHGHKRFAYKHSTFMYHQLSSATWGKLADMREDMEENNRLHDILCDLVVKKTKIPSSILKDNFEHKKDWYFDASTALKNGSVDEIIL